MDVVMGGITMVINRRPALGAGLVATLALGVAAPVLGAFTPVEPNPLIERSDDPDRRRRGERGRRGHRLAGGLQPGQPGHGAQHQSRGQLRAQRG